MASNEVNVENSNVSGSEDIYTDTNIVLNSVVLLVMVEHVDGRPIEPEILTETAINSVPVLTHHTHYMQLRSLAHMKFV